MIVVDSNVVAYCWLNGPLTATAQRVLARDPHWHVPILWRSELRSTLAGYCRSGMLAWGEASRVLAAAEKTLVRGEHLCLRARKSFASVKRRISAPMTRSSLPSRGNSVRHLSQRTAPS